MDGPIRPVAEPVLAGAVDRIDDPDPVRVDPREVVLRLLGEHGVAGPFRGEPLEQKRVGLTVAEIAQLTTRRAGGAQFNEETAGVGGQVDRELLVGEGVSHGVKFTCETPRRGHF